MSLTIVPAKFLTNDPKSSWTFLNSIVGAGVKGLVLSYCHPSRLKSELIEGKTPLSRPVFSFSLRSVLAVNLGFGAIPILLRSENFTRPLASARVLVRSAEKLLFRLLPLSVALSLRNPRVPSSSKGWLLALTNLALSPAWNSPVVDVSTKKASDPVVLSTPKPTVKPKPKSGVTPPLRLKPKLGKPKFSANEILGLKLLPILKLNAILLASVGVLMSLI